MLFPKWLTYLHQENHENDRENENGCENDQGNEEGLLSVAFHPQWPEKRELYCYYTAAKPRRSVLTRFTVAADGMSADPASEEVILTQTQPYPNHNGGTALFGPDGFLYLSLGDGGAANDPHHYAQNMNTFLGKVLRIDVNKKGDNGAPYAVPNIVVNTRHIEQAFFRSSHLRSPGRIENSFANESFMDETHLWQLGCVFCPRV